MAGHISRVNYKQIFIKVGADRLDPGNHYVIGTDWADVETFNRGWIWGENMKHMILEIFFLTKPAT